MNWEAVGAVAELLGALGVIVSLVYLAAQIRASTRVARATGFQSLVGNLHLSLGGLRDPDAAAFFVRGMASYDALEPHERFAFSQAMGSVMANFGTTLEFARQGIVNPSFVEANAEIVRSLFRSPGVREWWTSSEQLTQNREVREWVERHLDAAARAQGSGDSTSIQTSSPSSRTG